ncbi:MAG TPA: trans-aconitate 2-methyltransferase [Micromonosporaceae bacterium]
MTSPSWDPQQYLAFAAERARPFHDLVARISTEPRRIADLGCGPGNMTATLLERWPSAYVEGIDSSPEMIDAAARRATDRLTFTLGDIESWRPERPVDVIVANASLQWVPTHVDLLPNWVEALAPGGALAFQVPANADSPASRAFRTVAERPRWASALVGATVPTVSTYVRTVDHYLDLLAGLGCRVDAWETTYRHVLPGDDAVLAWYSGTGLRPYLDRLDGADREEFRREVAAELREAYPRRSYGTVLPFHRIFVIAYR